MTEHNSDRRDEQDGQATVLRFPAARDEDAGLAVHATAQRLDIEPDADAQGQPSPPDEPEAPGTELVPDHPRALQRLPRRPVLPPTVKAKAKAAGGQAWRHTRRHTTIVLKGAEDQRLRRKADREHSDLKAARRIAVERGDYTEAREISRQLVQDRHGTVEALQARIELAWSLTKKAAVAVTVLTGVAVVTGTINAFGHWLGPWDALDVLQLLGALVAGVFYTFRFVVTNWIALAPALLSVATVVWLSRRWRDGKRLGEAILPVDLRKGDSAVYVELDESALVNALANIGVPALKNHVKEGWPNRDTDRAWVQFPILDGNGVTAKLRLPLGAPVEKVRKAKVTLAHNLGCLPAELWVDKDRTDPSVLDLFRLNPGELRKPVPAYPLLEDGTTDYFTGFPVGISPRGEQITGVVFQRNHVYSGIMGSGKTTLVIAVIAGALLDPLVDVDVFCFAENADYDAFKDLLNTFVMGDTEDNVQACRDHIAELHADLAERGRLLQKHQVSSANREVAAKEPGLRPRIVVIDECQAYFRQDKPEDRRAVVNQIVRFFSAARKYGITCVFVTPVPSDQSLPRDLVSVATNRACYAIGDKARNNIVLGDKAHENGISALGLKPATKEELNDVGTCVTIGFTDIDGTTLRSFYLTRAEQDQLAHRASELRSGVAPAQEPERRDPVADALAVLGNEKGRAGEVVRAMAARWPHYRGWGIQDLVGALADEGIKVPSTGNVYPVAPDTLRNALAAREADQSDSAE